MNRALDAVFAGPRDHAASGRPIFHAAEADLAKKFHTGGSQFLEIFFDHTLFENGRAGINLDASRTKCLKGTLRENCHRLESDNVFRAARRVNLTSGNHGGDASVKTTVDPAELVLARRPIAAYRMYVAVDQSRSERRTFGVDHGGGSRSVDFLFSSDGVN